VALGTRREIGLTLIEVILLIACCVFLFALALPAVSRAREHALQVRSRSSLSQHVSIFSLYASDFRDIWPYFTDPKLDRSVITFDGGRSAVEAQYFSTVLLWPLALSDLYYNGQWRGEMFVTRDVPGSLANEYFYARNFVARPEFWNASSRSGDSSQLLPTRSFEVRFPSLKGLLCQPIRSGGQAGSIVLDPMPIGFVDGSARSVRRGELKPGESIGALGYRESWGQVGGVPVVDTPDGVFGRDL
jgi:hypothetical protein